jgi:hypothetical protein
MKKIIILTIIFIVSATSAGYAGIFRDQQENASSRNTSMQHENNAGSPEGTSSDDYGGFFRNSGPGAPGDRPGTGGGIGQNAPVSDGIPVILVCCAFFIVIKILDENRKN